MRPGSFHILQVLLEIWLVYQQLTFHSTDCPFLHHICNLESKYNDYSLFLPPGTWVLQEQIIPLEMCGFLMWVSCSVAFINPFALWSATVPKVSHPIYTIQSLPTALSTPAILTRKLRSFYGNYLCIFAFPSSIKLLHLSTFLPFILKNQESFLLLKAKPVFEIFPYHWCWEAFAISSFLFVLYVQLLHLCWPLSFNLYTFFKLLSKEVNQQTETNWPLFTRFHRHYHSISRLPSSFKLSIEAVCKHYLQFLRCSHSCVQRYLISNPI